MNPSVQFEAHFGQIINHCMTGYSMILGHDLGLFQRLNETPRTSPEIAELCGYKERYVREWLCSMVVAGLVKTDETGTRFWIPNEWSKAYDPSSSTMICLRWITKMVQEIGEKIIKCFKIEGPSGTTYAEYANFHSEMARLSSGVFGKPLLLKIISNVSGMNNILSTGGLFVDVGCGAGNISYMIAEEFPRCKSYGVDLDSNAIQLAQSNSKGLRNLEYLLSDATKLPEQWSGSFDFVTTFDCIHDQPYPEKSINEIFRILKSGGFYSMIENDAHSDVVQNLTHPNAQFLYTVSLFHCLPIALNDAPDAIGLGTAWGREKAQEMLAKAGFVSMTFYGLDDPLYHYQCVCQKP